MELSVGLNPFELAGDAAQSANLVVERLILTTT
jgi:hypothetical protein